MKRKGSGVARPGDSETRPIFGGIEAGGTKFVCAVGTGPQEVRSETWIPTTDPEETIGRAIEFFREQAAQVELSALGIASFGPVDLDPSSTTYGSLTSTPKPGWRDIDLLGPLATALGVPVGFDTDVNGAALSEGRWGAARELDTFVYLTVGTGIGGGVVIGGDAVHGMVHPEMGHMLVGRRDDDDFAGACPFHDACLEGLASGPALEGRWGSRAEALTAEHPAWELEAHYLAMGVTNLVCAVSPERVILGGGVMQQGHLFPLIRRKVLDLLNGYIQAPAVTENVDTYIAPASLGSRSGVLGALVLAERALEEEMATR